MLDSRAARGAQDLEIRKQILQRQRVVTTPKCGDAVRSFWTTFARTYSTAYDNQDEDVAFRQSDEVLADYPPATPGACVLFSGGVESTYLMLMNPGLRRFTIEADAEVHPRGGEMFIRARAEGFGEILYGTEKEWGERDGCMLDRRTGKRIASEGFEFTEEFRRLWWQYLGVRIQCPTEHLYKDEIVQRIFEISKEAYSSLQSCWTLKQGWCGYCDKCLMTGAIINALDLPPLFRMERSEYSEAITQELNTYQTGDYDPFWRLPVFKRLKDIYGYSLTI